MACGSLALIMFVHVFVCVCVCVCVCVTSRFGVQASNRPDSVFALAGGIPVSPVRGQIKDFAPGEGLLAV